MRERQISRNLTACVSVHHFQTYSLAEIGHCAVSFLVPAYHPNPLAPSHLIVEQGDWQRATEGCWHLVLTRCFHLLPHLCIYTMCMRVCEGERVRVRLWVSVYMCVVQNTNVYSRIFLMKRVLLQQNNLSVFFPLDTENLWNIIDIFIFTLVHSRIFRSCTLRFRRRVAFISLVPADRYL